MSFFTTAAKDTSLKILVFGPNPEAAVAKPTERIGRLAKKRIEIRDWLIAEGHEAQFPEDIYDKTSPGPLGNIVYQEMVMMKQTDLIVVIVDSPGSNVELGAICTHAALAQKTHAFIDTTYAGGFAHQSCELLEHLDGRFFSYCFPDDIDGCHLRGKIASMVTKVQLVKYLA